MKNHAIYEELHNFAPKNTFYLNKKSFAAVCIGFFILFISMVFVTAVIAITI